MAVPVRFGYIDSAMTGGRPPTADRKGYHVKRKRRHLHDNKKQRNKT